MASIKPDAKDVQVGVVLGLLALVSGIMVLASSSKAGAAPPPPPPPPPGTGNLYGLITNRATGAAVAGARVTLTAPDGTSASVPSDATGAYGFLAVPAGITVTWTVTAAGYADAAGAVTLTATSQRMDVPLDPIPPPGNNVITFGTLDGARIPAVDAGGNPLTWSTINLDCLVTNSGPATIRQIQIWVGPVGYPQDAGVRAVISLATGPNASVPFAYRGNPIGAGSILMQTGTPYDFRLIDAGSGSSSETIRR